MPLPEAVADHRDRSGVPAAVEIVIRREDAAAHGGHAEDAEEIAADPQAFREMALAARGQIEAVRAEGQGSGEGLLVIAHLLPDRVGEIGVYGRAGSGGEPSCTSRCGSSTGSERSITALRMLKMAVLAPMPSARDSTAVAAKPGLARRVRRA
jgi:hypothetical protein